MAIKLESTDYDVDMNLDMDTIKEKFPHQMASSTLSELHEFHQIPCDRLEIFQTKELGDFTPWDGKKFQELKDSIQEHGVIEPITVRPIPQSNKFEILAGEHRWKASRELGLASIPARVQTACSDDEAIAIFTLTNIMKRDTTLKDKAFGCWLYTTKTKYKTPSKIKELVEQGVLKEEDVDNPLSRTQQYRYTKIYQLPDVLFHLLETNIINMEAGVRLCKLDSFQQEDLTGYLDFVKDSNSIHRVVDLAEGKLEGLYWDEDSLLKVLQNKRVLQDKEENKSSLSYVAKRSKAILKERLPKELYENIDDVINESLSLYFEKYNIKEEI